jgi:hypothetical protein
MTSIEELQRRAGLFLRWACGGPEGRPESDPIYQRVTEGRDVGAMQRKYSSCGDLAHALYEFLGIRGRWVNRAALGHYVIGHNIARLNGHPGKREPRFSDTFEAGDVLVVWNQPDTEDAHVICVLGMDGGHLQTAEYGQPGGALRERRLEVANSGLLIGGRLARVWLPLHRVIALAKQEGELVPTEPTLLSQLEAYPEPAA